MQRYHLHAKQIKPELEPFKPKGYFSVRKPKNQADQKNHADNKGYLIIYPKGRKLLKDYFYYKYHSKKSNDIQNYIKLKRLKIANEIEIQFYINQILKKFPNFIKNGEDKKFIRAAKIEFYKQGKLQYKQPRKGLYELAKKFCHHLKNSEKKELPVEAKLSSSKQAAMTAAETVLRETRKKYPLGSHNISPLLINPFTGKIKFFRELTATNHTPQRKRLDAILEQKFSDLANKRIKDTRKDIENAFQEIELSPRVDVMLKRSLFAKKSAKTGAGACDELATHAFLYLINIFPGKIELAEFTYSNTIESKKIESKKPPTVYFDHVFVVLNRPDDSKKEDWKTWGKDTIIVDLWINKTFTADKFAEVWQDNPWGFNPHAIKIHIQFDDSAFKDAPLKGSKKA